jgi:hypothetical protein
MDLKDVSTKIAQIGRASAEQISSLTALDAAVGDGGAWNEGKP